MSFVNDAENRRRAKDRLDEQEVNLERSDDEGEDESIDWKITESLIQEFCSCNYLQIKAIKEVHFLCLQLEKMMREDIMINQNTKLED